MNRKAIFLDRDGTIIVDKEYLSDESDIQFIEGVPETLKMLKQRGYLLIVISNQSGVARGFFENDKVKVVHQGMNDILKKEYGFEIDAFYYCPHHPEYGEVSERHCKCRKPEPGLIEDAIREFSIDIHESIMIGDKESDKIRLEGLKFIKVEKDKDWSRLVRSHIDSLYR